MDEKTKTPSELEALTKRIENLEMWLLAAKYMVGGTWFGKSYGITFFPGFSFKG